MRTAKVERLGRGRGRRNDMIGEAMIGLVQA